MAQVFTRAQLREFRRSKPVRSTLFVVGILMMLASPIVGLIPGPGGILVFAPGLALALQNSDWAKRQYVKFKKWQPNVGRWTDWGLRRRSALRREQIRKIREHSAELRALRIGRSRTRIHFDYFLRANAPSLFRFLQRRRARQRKSFRALADRLQGGNNEQIQRWAN